MSEEIQDINLETQEAPVEQTETTQEVPQEESPQWTANFEGMKEPPKLENDAVQQVQEQPSSDESVLRNERVEQEDQVETEVESEIEKVEEEVEKPSTEQVTDTQLSEDIQASQEASTQNQGQLDDMPDWIKEQYEFHKETGGSLDDYLKVKQDFSKLPEDTLVKEYIKAQNPNFTDEEVQWEMEDLFGIDEDYDEDSKEYRKAVLKKKRFVNDAISHFKGIQDKYTADLKAGNVNVPEQYKEAYNIVQAQQEQAKQQEEYRKTFIENSNKVFNEQFRGFSFDTGNGKYRIVESNRDAIRDSQVDLDKFTGEFLDDKGQIKDAEAWHKALYAAKNADKIARHFYQQGRAEALKERAKVTKNIDMTPKASSSDSTKSGGGGMKFNFLNSDRGRQ